VVEPGHDGLRRGGWLERHQTSLWQPDGPAIANDALYIGMFGATRRRQPRRTGCRKVTR
jgi:hypothetical protein